MEIRLVDERGVPDLCEQLEQFLLERGQVAVSRMPGILDVLRRGLGHQPMVVVAVEGDRVRGLLPLAHVRSLLFGGFLVSLPYVNSGGVIADDAGIARGLVGAAIEVADRLRVRYLELRHEQAVEHPALSCQMTTKVHMRLALPETPDALWKALESKVRNQVRKGTKNGLTVTWGGADLLEDFFLVFSRNMRDLGTPVYGRSFFKGLLSAFRTRAEICVVRNDGQTLASGLLLHGAGITEVPSASSLREYNHTNANMLLYWNLLMRAIERGQSSFDFGRSSLGSNTYRFKKQWGAVECPATWQYYVREGTATQMRPENAKFRLFIRAWKRLPVAVANRIGPFLVRGIP